MDFRPSCRERSAGVTPYPAVRANASIKEPNHVLKYLYEVHLVCGTHEVTKRGFVHAVFSGRPHIWTASDSSTCYHSGWVVHVCCVMGHLCPLYLARPLIWSKTIVMILQ